MFEEKWLEVKFIADWNAGFTSVFTAHAYFQTLEMQLKKNSQCAVENLSSYFRSDS
jgi:hypothetical protein